MAKTELPLDKKMWRPSPLPGQVVLVTSADEQGHLCVAPKSWVTMVAFGPPPIVMFGCNTEHATAKNIEATKAFVINFPGIELVETCWALGSDPTVRGPDRFAAHGLKVLDGLKVKAPRIAQCQAHFECELDSFKTWGKELGIFGKIVSVSMDENTLKDDPRQGYETLAPFFFLEAGYTARLGRAMPVEAVSHGPQQVLTIMSVEDLELSKAFYQRAFDWPLRVDVPAYAEFELPDGRGLGLFRKEGFARQTGKAPQSLSAETVRGTEIYLHCLDLDDAIERLEAADALLLSERAPREWGDEAAYYADPDGNVLVLAHRLEEQ